MEEADKLILKFSYTDMFNNETNLYKTISSCAVDDSSEYDILVSEFRNFLVSCGFTEEVVKSRIV